MACMTSDITSKDTSWPRAFRWAKGCRFCPGGPATNETMTLGTVKAVDGTYEMFAHQPGCPELNPDPPLDI